VRPSYDSIHGIIGWLAQYGIQVDDSAFSGSKGFITLSTSVAVASRLLDTKYETYKHITQGNTVIKAASQYKIPVHLKQHIDFISGHIGFPLSVKPLYTIVGDDAIITPPVLRSRYNVSDNLVGTHPNNSYAVAEFQAQYYSPSDLAEFFKQYVPFAPKDSNVSHVVGSNDGSHPGVEANLDIQYIKGVAPGVATWFWSNPSLDFFSDVVAWLTQIDSTANAPLIQSVSYGSQKEWPTSDIHNRVDVEFQKSGVRGLSIIFASGDSGTGCIACTQFKPSWPASSQYVTAVGATRFSDGKSGAEMAVQGFGSGGGFSSSDNQPSYQAAQVAHYFSVQTDLPEPFFYNKSGRGTPDVAALGIGFLIYQKGHVMNIGGTSASCPTFAAIVSLLNDIRLNAGKSPLGFLNPWLYSIKTPDAFFDVTTGNNRDGCCGLTGWQAAPGWDPVTGLGTPNFAVLSKLV